MFLNEIINALERHKVNYAIVGGYAMALHGLIRATMDVDLVISMTKKDLKLCQQAFLEIGLKSKLPINSDDVYRFRDEYINNRNMVAWSFVDYKNPTRIVDVLITHSLKKINTKKVSLAGKKVTVASLKDLIKMKKLSGRPQDLLDIENMEKILNEKSNT